MLLVQCEFFILCIDCFVCFAFSVLFGSTSLADLGNLPAPKIIHERIDPVYVAIAAIAMLSRSSSSAQAAS